MTAQSDTATPKRSTFAALAVFGERRALVMLALGFSAGLPFFLVFDTLSAWLRDAGLTLEVIGLFSLATLVYSFKFLWAPFIDRTKVPYLTQRLGHRRSWMLVTQGFIMLGLWLIAGVDPASSLGWMAAFAVFVGFCGATQDITIDAWRIEAAEISKQGAMAAAYQWGYRIALLVAGALPLILAQSYSWNVSYGAMAALMSVGVLGVLAAPREAQHAIREIHAEGLRRAPIADGIEWFARVLLMAMGALFVGSGLSANAGALAWVLGGLGLGALGETLRAAWGPPFGVWYQLMSVAAGFGVIGLAAFPVPGLRTRPGVYLSTALGEPLQDFIARHRGAAALILALICFYRLSDFVLNIMNPFYLDLGFTLIEVAEVRKIFGLVTTILGIFAGGAAIARFGLIPSLVVGAFAGPLSNLTFIWLAMRGHDLFALFVAIGIDNIASGFAGTCLIAYMSSLTGQGFTATQYALFSSLYAVPGRLVASQSGRIVEGAAQGADGGGVFSAFNGLFANLPAESFAAAFEKSGVSPAALGSGYVAFFIYSTLVGIIAVVLAFAVARRQGTGAASTP